MTRDVVTVSLTTPYQQIVDLISERRICAVPVVDDFRRVLGAVSHG